MLCAATTHDPGKGIKRIRSYLTTFFFFFFFSSFSWHVVKKNIISDQHLCSSPHPGSGFLSGHRFGFVGSILFKVPVHIVRHAASQPIERLLTCVRRSCAKLVRNTPRKMLKVVLNFVKQTNRLVLSRAYVWKIKQKPCSQWGHFSDTAWAAP